MTHVGPCSPLPTRTLHPENVVRPRMAAWHSGDVQLPSADSAFCRPLDMGPIPHAPPSFCTEVLVLITGMCSCLAGGW